MEERSADLSQTLAEEEEKAKHLSKLKAKHETTIAELEEKLAKDHQQRQEADRVKRKIEAEVQDLKEQLNERKTQIEETYLQLGKKEEELAQAMTRMDEESAIRAAAQKNFRELESQFADLQEDLEAEKVARSKAEKQKRDLNEELEALKSELLDSLDTTAGSYFYKSLNIYVEIPLIFVNLIFLAQQELRSKREQEVITLKKNLEEESVSHEATIADMRHKHSQEIQVTNERIEQLNKVKAGLEKSKQTLEAENADLAQDLRTVGASRAEAERRRKQVEQQLQEFTARLQETERVRYDVIQ